MKLKYRVHKINLSFEICFLFLLWNTPNQAERYYIALHVFENILRKKISYKFEKNESLIRARLIFGLMGVVIILNKLCD